MPHTTRSSSRSRAGQVSAATLLLLADSRKKKTDAPVLGKYRAKVNRPDRTRLLQHLFLSPLAEFVHAANLCCETCVFNAAMSAYIVERVVNVVSSSKSNGMIVKVVIIGRLPPRIE